MPAYQQFLVTISRKLLEFGTLNRRNAEGETIVPGVLCLHGYPPTAALACVRLDPLCRYLQRLFPLLPALVFPAPESGRKTLPGKTLRRSRSRVPDCPKPASAGRHRCRYAPPPRRYTGRSRQNRRSRSGAGTRGSIRGTEPQRRHGIAGAGRSAHAQASIQRSLRRILPSLAHLRLGETDAAHDFFRQAVAPGIESLNAQRAQARLNELGG